VLLGLLYHCTHGTFGHPATSVWIWSFWNVSCLWLLSSCINPAPYVHLEDKSMQKANGVLVSSDSERIVYWPVSVCVCESVCHVHFQYSCSIHFWCFMNDLQEQVINQICWQKWKIIMITVSDWMKCRQTDSCPCDTTMLGTQGKQISIQNQNVDNKSTFWYSYK